MPLGLEFRPSLVPTIAAIVMLAVLVSLGRWQLGRAAEKEIAAVAFRTQQASAPRPLTSVSLEGLERFTPVVVEGRFDAAHQFLLDNRTRNGRAGYHVLTPFSIDANAVVIVNRGWLPASPDRAVLPDLEMEGVGPKTITGTLVSARESQFVLGDTGYSSSAWPKVVQRVELVAMASALRREVLEQVLLLDPNQPQGYRREWSPYIGISPDRHRGYATQWFALAVTLIVIYVVVTFRRRT